MTPINEMSPEQRLWTKKMILMLVDAIDGPIEAPKPWVSDPDLFGERKSKFGVTEFYMAEYEARIDAGYLIETLDPEFTFCCDVVDADPIRLREKFVDGELDRVALMEFYTRLGRE